MVQTFSYSLHHLQLGENLFSKQKESESTGVLPLSFLLEMGKKGRELAKFTGGGQAASAAASRVSITATSARVAEPWGLRVLAVLPVMMPTLTAQSMADRA